MCMYMFVCDLVIVCGMASTKAHAACMNTSTHTHSTQMLFDEIIGSCLSLITDVFGNYVIQRFLDHGSEQQREVRTDGCTQQGMYGHMYGHMHGVHR
jgi:hypothetical protein